MMSNVNQIFDYPKGARVEAITPILCHLGSIPSGTKGTVKGHCDDGRAWVFFDGYMAGHTFHEPERSIRVIEQPSHEQPASAPVEHEQPKLIDQLLDAVAYAEDIDRRVTARLQVVKAWNQHQHCATQLQYLGNRAEELSSLLAGMTTERDGLREVLRQAREQIEFLEQALEKYHGSRQRNPALDVIDAALNHAEQGKGEYVHDETYKLNRDLEAE